MLKRITSMLIAAIIIIGLTSAYSTGNITIVAVNDELRDLKASTMPIVKNGQHYVPYKIFATGDNNKSTLGLLGSYNSKLQTLILYDWDYSLTFNLADNTVIDEKANKYSQTAIYKNGTIYVPVRLVCNKFGLSYNILSSSDYPVLRIKNANATLPDNTFLSVADSIINQMVSTYKDTQQPIVNPVTPDITTPTVPPTPDVPKPTIPDKTETIIRPTSVYLTFDGLLNDNTQTILTILNDYNVRATFFVDPSSILSNDDLIRQIIGRGHSIGISINPKTITDPQSLLDTLDAANSDLSFISGITTRLIRIEGGSQNLLNNEFVNFLNEHGYRLWDYTFTSGDVWTGSAQKTLDNVIAALRNTNGRLIVRFGNTQAASLALPEILKEITSASIHTYTIFDFDTPVNFYSN